TGVYVAESLGEASALRPTLRDGESVVTREGVWMGRNWVRINRSDDPQVGVIARGDEIKRLNESIRDTAKRADEVAKALADTRSQVERLEEARVTAQAEAGRRQQLLTETRTNLGACRSELEQSRSRAAVLDRAIADLAAEQRTLVTSLDESRARRASAVERQAVLATAREDVERLRREQQERVTG